MLTVGKGGRDLEQRPSRTSIPHGHMRIATMLMQIGLAIAAFVAQAAQTTDQIAKSRQAKELMAAGRFADAIPLYEELVRVLPGNPGLLLNLGMSQHMAGNDSAAIGQFEKVLKLDATIFPANAMMGAAYMRLGETSAAVSPLRAAVRLQPKNASVRQMLADALATLGQHSEAVVQYAELTQQEPGNPHAWYGLGTSYEALAQRTFDQLARTSPGSARWLALVGESRIRHKQNSSAFYFYKQALAKEPRLRGAHAALAAIYRDTGHADWAQTEEQKEQAIPPPDCRTAVAECRFRSGDLAGAIAATKLDNTPEGRYWRTKAYNAQAASAFQALVALGPSVPLHRFQSEQHRNQGRHQDALKELEQALSSHPDDRSLKQDFAMTLYLARDYAAAEKQFRELLERQTDTVDLQFLLGDTLLQLQRPDEAIPVLKSVLQRNPKHLPARAVLGRALLQTGDAAGAIPHLQAALAIDEDGSTHYQLIRAAQAAGNAKIAADARVKYEHIQKMNEAAKKELEEQAAITAPEPQ